MKTKRINYEKEFGPFGLEFKYVRVQKNSEPRTAKSINYKKEIGPLSVEFQYERGEEAVS